MKTFLSLLLFSTACVHAAEFHGHLSPDVRIGKQALIPVVPAPAELVAALPAAPGPDDKVWVPKRSINIKGKDYLAVIVAAASGTKTLWLDRDGDRKFSADERWPFSADQNEARLDLPWDNGIYRRFPLRVVVLNRPLSSLRNAPAPAEPAAEPAPTDVTSLVYNFNISFTGSVDVDGKPMLVEFYPLPMVITIDPAQISTGMDTNFDGKIERELGEAENTHGQIPVFRVGTHFLAVKSADVNTGDLVLEERPASDYTRFDASPGQTMPEFAFVDFGGGQHKLSDYRGKFVLLDFWGTWCGPCVEEMRHLDPVYAKYQSRGFEVIGMDMERTAGKLSAADYATVTEKARQFVATAGHPWPQATQESIERVALDVVHVNQYPTMILIGPDGKIVSREVRGEQLTTLLEKLLPEKP